MARGKQQTETRKEPAKPSPDITQAATTEATAKDGSNSSRAPIEPPSKPVAKAEDELALHSFEVLSRLKRDGERFKPGDQITLDRSGFEELKRFRVVSGTFEDGEPVKA
ncbi:MAG: hypothetical protein H6887_14925 [Hoeflea sp.]|nr:hypothetical protein [Hoeflea sp.]